MSFTQPLYHIVFSPKFREPVIQPEIQRDVYMMIYKQVLRQRGKVFRINGMEDHVHILASFPADLIPSNAIKVIKQETSRNIMSRRLIHNWQGWQEGYSAFTCSYREKDAIIKYIKDQELHHTNETFLNELQRLLMTHGISRDNPYFPAE